MQTNIPISVVIPTYNRAHLIGRAIASVLNQRQQPCEIIVVDDGSTDATAELVEQWDRQITYVLQHNSGAAAARDRGIRMATAPWIAFLDSDDIWDTDHLYRMTQVIHATGGVARLYFADTLRSAVDKNQRQWALANLDFDSSFVLCDDAADWVMQRRQPMMLQSSVVSKSAYLATGGFYQSLRTREDTHLFLKLGIGGRACAVKGIGCYMSDDDHANRLTLNHQQVEHGRRMQVLMFHELLTRDLPLQASHRIELQQRLTEAHRALAKLAWQERKVLSLLRNVSHSLFWQSKYLLHLP